MILRCQVEPADEGMSLGRIIREKMDVSASLLRSLKHVPGGIRLDGAEVYVNVLPRAGQVIELFPRERRQENILPQRGELDIRYEDELMLILNKPRGMAVHPSRGHPYNTLANYVLGLFEERGEDSGFHAVNRLDRGTGGLMCIAKNAYGAAVLTRALAEGRLTRAYYALCDGILSPAEGVIDLPIGRAEGAGIKRCITPEGKRAVTRYKTIKTGGGRSLLHITLDTGRTHQIRVHMAHMGAPVTGDFMYGRELAGFEGTALCSCMTAISLPHGEIRAELPPPEEFLRLMEGEPKGEI